MGRCHHQLVLHLDSEFSSDLRTHCHAVPVSPLVCLRTGVLECLGDATVHLDFVSCTVGVLAGTHQVPPMPRQDGIGSRAPTLVVALRRWWWTRHVDDAHTRVPQAHLLDS